MGKPSMIARYLYESSKSKICSTMTTFSSKYLLGTSLMPIKNEIIPYGFNKQVQILNCELIDTTDDKSIGYRQTIDLTIYFIYFITHNEMNVNRFMAFINKHTNIKVNDNYTLLSFYIIDDHECKHHLIDIKNKKDLKKNKNLKFGDIELNISIPANTEETKND